MKLINADKYKKDIEHYRNTICYQRNVTMDDCMRILDNQEDVLDKIREEIKSKKFGLTDTEDGRRIQSDIHAGFDGGIECALQVIDKYMERSE